MNIKEFSRKIIEMMPQINRGFARYEHDYLTKGEITLPQFWVLNYLYNNKTAKMGQLAQYLSITRPAITGLVDRLIMQGLVIRKDDSADRRIVWIELNFKGREIIRSIREHKIRILEKVFAKVSADDRRRYVNILEQVVKIVESLPRASDKKQVKLKNRY